MLLLNSPLIPKPLFLRLPPSSAQTLTPTSTTTRRRRSTPSSPLALSSLTCPPPLLQIVPFVQTQWRPVLAGWIFSAASICCLSASLPRLARLPSLQSPAEMAAEGLVLAALACARSAMVYLQQAFLWEAALGSAYGIRTHVFSRVVERDLGFFEGNEGVPYGDIAQRITAEASDVADTLYALFNTIVPNSLQLSAMAAQMIAISPVLSLMSALAPEDIREGTVEYC